MNMVRRKPSLTMSIQASTFFGGVGFGLGFFFLLMKIAFAANATTPPVKADINQETLITATAMSSDQATNIVTATGHVEISRGGYILHADKVTYNQKTGVMHAEGHVATLMPSGEVEFSDRQDVTGDMKQAFVENVGILFPDNARMTARVAQRYDGRYTVADKAMFTACNVCKENPDNPPLWQMHAQQIVHDNVEHDIYYHYATIEMAGVPVFYTPYFSTPDPTVDRRQGFLTPTPGVNSNIGTFVRVPYYFDIAPETDMTITPTFSTKDDLQLGSQFRHRFENGSLVLDGSFTRADLVNTNGTDEGQQWRGHLFGNFLYNIDNVWRAGTDIQMASDKSYLQRYNYSSLDQLTNRFYVEGFKGRDYAAVNSYYYEDLRPGSTVSQPLVLPQSSFSALGEPGQMWGGRWSANGNMLVTTRDNQNQGLSQQGPDTRRLYFDGGWQRQFISDTGLLMTVSGMARVDGEYADNVINPNGSGNNYNNSLTAHQFEQAMGTARYPLARSGDGYQQLLEPIVSLITSPVVHLDNRQPLEDSRDVQFDETNLFSGNRFTGYDLAEGGSRAVYGLRHAITGDDGQRVDMFGGQSYRFNQDRQFSDSSGLHNHMSDYVGRIEFTPASWLTFNYGARFDQKDFTAQRQDALLSAGATVFRPYVHYISGKIFDTNNILVDNKEAILGFDSTIEKYYHLSISHTQAFAPQPGARTTGATISYIDECYIFAVNISHDDYSRVDVASGTSVTFHMFLKDVGGIASDSYSAGRDAYPTTFRQSDDITKP